MTKPLLLSGLVWCLTSLPATACYLIQTKGAGEFKASSYWREGQEIKFYLGDGVIGVASADIQRIIRLPVNGHNPCQIRRQPDLPEAASAEDQDSAEAAETAAAHARATVPSEAYLQFETDVIEVERALHRVGIMSAEELLDVAKRADALKKRMLGHREVGVLHPLLVRMDVALDRIESVLSR